MSASSETRVRAQCARDQQGSVSGLRLCLSGLGLGLFVAGGWTQSESTGVSQADFGGSCSRHCFPRASCVLGDEVDKFLLLQSWHPVGVKGGGGQLGLSLPRLPSVGSLKSALVGIFASQQ